MEGWIRNREFSRLLDHWVKGLSIDWERLYDESKPRRISLPTYPFDGNRYWIETDHVGKRKAFPQAVEPSAQSAAKKFAPEDGYDEKFHASLLDRLVSREISVEEAIQKIRN